MKTAIRNRVDRLERIFDAVAAETPEPTVPARYLNGTFTGIIREGDAVAVRIARPLTFTRDSDGSWLIYSWHGDDDQDVESITVRDPVGCDVLDALFELAANPDDFAGEYIAADDAD